MPRIRSIKPEFFMSETISKLPFRARLTFVGLWTYCDDDGRGRDNPRLVKAAVWALDDVSSEDVEVDLVLLSEAGLVHRYVVDGKCFFRVPSWSEHQRVSHPTASRIPSPEGTISGAAREDSGESHEDSGSFLPGTGNREQGKEQGTGKGSTLAKLAAQTFPEFWLTYPRKVDKRNAEKAYLAALKRGASPELIVKAAKLYADNRVNTDLRYVKYAASWLNAGAYDDEPEPESQPRQNGHQPYKNPKPEDYSAPPDWGDES